MPPYIVAPRRMQRISEENTAVIEESIIAFARRGRAAVLARCVSVVPIAPARTFIRLVYARRTVSARAGTADRMHV
ncbi:hypothetical protein GCM10010915_18490 [Microbacterium faecale]|uniref:Uncharacterized protein n=1 Tax=Microbacterium faecale TaxID=1804630 RepID=A0A917DHG6_9MICO|nr:hypothetical protein GCM10010915_18490 [Microbacterium faecale]